MKLHLEKTTTAAVNDKLVKLREEGGVVALGRVLTLIISTPKGQEEEAIKAAKEASREHPMRVIVVAENTQRSSNRLDAEIRVGADAGASEIVILEVSGELINQKASLVTGLILPDAPIVTLWPNETPENAAKSTLGKISQRRITDSANTVDPMKTLKDLAATYADGDTDFAWTRLTHWREQLVAVFNNFKNPRVESITVKGATDSPSSYLLAAWLGKDLKQDACLEDSGKGTGVTGVNITFKDGGVVNMFRPIGKETAELTQPGEQKQTLSLPRRNLPDCLAEELRRIDADEVYGEVLTKGLSRVKLKHENTTDKDAAKPASTAKKTAAKKTTKK
ncbi:MAG: glucose-6-phosphate dehydrogenase assembly protein OpcA [Micrococcaceae bacterium]